MISLLEYCKNKYYAQNHYDDVLSLIQKNITQDIKSIDNTMLSIFYDFIHKEPYYYWDKKTFEQTKINLESLFKNHSIELTINEEILEHFLFGYHTHRQTAEVINDLRGLNDNPEIKTRLYRIPTYISIVEGCLSNLFRVITLLLNQTTPKDYKSQNKLKQLCNLLEKNAFNLLVSHVNVDIRNAINHGGVFYKIINGAPTVEFQYVKNRETHVLHMPIYEFDELIDKTFDAASGILLGITTFFNNHISLFDVNLHEKLFIPFSLLALEISIPNTRCRSISNLKDNKQLNIDMYIKNTNQGHINQLAIMIALIVYDRYNDYDQYMISFSNERLQPSWIRFTNLEVQQMFLGTADFHKTLQHTIARGDYMVWETSTEELDLNEIKYFRFPNHKNEAYLINKVEDASIENRKRLKAHLYIEDIDSRDTIIKVITESINWIKKLKNMPSPTLPIKHGEVEADSVYLNVYRKDTRHDKNIIPNNTNFVCMVDYNIDKKTTLKNGGIPESVWRNLNTETVGNMMISWRSSKYLQLKRVNIGRNSTCPCGSGKKYKKCCSGLF
jgi:hypothetical protein